MSAGRYQTNAYLTEPALDNVGVRVKSATQTIYVQKITYSPSEFVALSVLSFTDSLTGKSFGQISVLPVAVGQTTQYIVDFGADGTPLTRGANLLIKILSGGMTGKLDIKAYQIPAYVVAPRVASSTAGFTA